MERLAAVSRHLAGCPAPAPAATRPPQHGGPTPFEVPLGERQLFLDLHGVASHSGLTHLISPPDEARPCEHTRTPHRSLSASGRVLTDYMWPQVVLPASGEDSVQIRSAPAFVPGEQLYKLWLLEEEPGIRLATSKDGLHWERPTRQVISTNTQNMPFFTSSFDLF